MDYYFYNTDADWIIGPPLFSILIDRGFAAVGGDPQRIGEQFRQLKQDDVLMMYENKVGVVAVGRVREAWDGIQHTQLWYYTPDETAEFAAGAFEYRIKVEWFRDLSNDPITPKLILQSLGFTPRKSIGYYPNNQAKIEKMLGELLITPLQMPTTIDLSSTERIKTTTYRILRDTFMASYIKDLHEYRCQVCGKTIELSNGKRYAEAHHIRPLGIPHNGPDVKGNILCLCPNHHVELDYGVLPITVSELICTKGHEIDPKYVDYHNQSVYRSILSTKQKK